MNRKKLLLGVWLLVILGIVPSFAQNNALPLEAENAVSIGSDYATVTEGDVTYVTPSTDFANTSNPGTADKVLTFQINFPAAGTFALYAKVRVGPSGADDDSFFVANSFGEKSPTSDADWTVINNIGNGAANPDDYVLSYAENFVGNELFKWINTSIVEGPVFTVEAGNLTQTFQMGARENGLDVDKIAFANSELFYTVDNLEKGEAGVAEVPESETPDPIALGQDKFLGSGWTPASFNFDWYWNQITPGNAGKWGSVEPTRDNMNWSQMDQCYNLGKDNDMYVKHHVLVWGSQQPDWIENLTPEAQLAEIEEWFRAVAERYPDLDAIEVVNEPLHQPPDAAHEGNYIEALGGSGETGWDWIITSFQMARDIFPSTVKLMINDYGIINDRNATDDYLEIINLLKDRGLIDQIGIQGHAFSINNLSPTTATINLNLLGSTGLPVYVTELDLDGFDDYVQLQRYQRIFPTLWEHQYVQGITIWGYASSDHWRADQGAYLINPNGSLRPSFVWLRAYVEGNFEEITAIDITAAGNATGIATPVGTLQLTAELAPESATLTNVEWTSSNPDVATVNADGQVTAVDNGNVIITARTQDGSELTATKALTISNQVVTSFEKAYPELEIYPNPSSQGVFYLKGLKGLQQLRIMTSNGVEIRTISIQRPELQINLGERPGLYLFQFIDGKQAVVQKVLVN